MTPLQHNINHKAYSSCASYGTYEEVLNHSQIERFNVFPYPFYFNSNPFSEEPTINPRRAGWSPQISKPSPILTPDPYPNHCFQVPCNTRFTDEISAAPGGAGAKGKSAPVAPIAPPSKPPIPAPSDRCSTNRCIVLYR